MKLSFVLLIVSFILAAGAEAAKATADPQECEVCVKVLDNISELIGKKSKKDAAVVEGAIDEYCGKSGIGAKEKKVCYYFDPIKRSVSRPMGLGLPHKKVCERLKKGNPEICEVKYALTVEKDVDYTKLRVKQLKKLLSERGQKCEGCVEKSDFVKKVTEVMRDEL